MELQLTTGMIVEETATQFNVSLSLMSGLLIVREVFKGLKSLGFDSVQILTNQKNPSSRRELTSGFFSGSLTYDLSDQNHMTLLQIPRKSFMLILKLLDA